MTRLWTVTGLLVLVVAATGCAMFKTDKEKRGTPLYEGTRLPLAEVVVLRVDKTARSGVGLKYLSIDEQAVRWQHLEVLPGRRDLVVQMNVRQTVSGPFGQHTWKTPVQCTGTLEAAAGRDYSVFGRPRVDRQTHALIYEAWITDASLDGHKVLDLDCYGSRAAP